MKKRYIRLLMLLGLTVLLAILAGCTQQSSMMGSSDQMMKMINQDPVKMADSMSSPDVRKSMVKIMSSDKMLPAMEDIMKTPEMQKSMIKIISNPSMRETMIKIMADPAIKNQFLSMLKDSRLKPVAQEATK